MNKECVENKINIFHDFFVNIVLANDGVPGVV